MESQIIEYKQSWRDEFLKEICGFANAQGGTLYIGIDDKGNVVGIVLAIVLLFVGIPFMWLIDLVCILLGGRVWWID